MHAFTNTELLDATGELTTIEFVTYVIAHWLFHALFLLLNEKFEKHPALICNACYLIVVTHLQIASSIVGIILIPKL